MDKEYLKNIVIDQRDSITEKIKKEKVVERDGSVWVWIYIVLANEENLEEIRVLKNEN